MKAMPSDFLAELEEHGTTVAMDVDDAEALEIFGGAEGPIAALDHRLADADFFNCFQDDFDDSDIN